MLTLGYPTADRNADHVEYHGNRVPDPYRWLEDVDSQETEAWINHQVELTQSHLTSPECSSLVQSFKNCLTEVWNYPRFSCPFEHGKQWFQLRNSGLQNQSVLFKFSKGVDSEASILIDPNTLSDDGTIALMQSVFSECGKYLAYSLSKSGSDWRTIHVKDVASGENRSDLIEWVKFSSMSWTHDSLGFFYSRYRQPNSSGDALGTEVDEAKNQLVYYHWLGTNQSDDVLVYSDETKPNYMFSVEVSNCGSYAILSISESCEPMNKLYVASLKEFGPENRNLPFKPIIDEMKSEYSYVTNSKSNLFFRSNADADRYRVVSIDLDQPAPNGQYVVKEVIPESDHVLESVVACGNGLLFLEYIQHVVSSCSIADLEGRSRHEIELPRVGAVAGISAHHDSTDVYFKFTSFIDPGIVYHLDLSSFKSTIWKEMTVPGLSAELFSTEQVFYKSKDGTAKVPMFILRKNDAANAPRPTILYGYGGFNISLTPYFSVLKLAFIKHCDAQFAIANLRGGGEYGKQWHQAGTKLRKQNVFDDFISAAEFLIERGDTTSNQLAITGGSNGGLLVAACLNQRPDLFNCVVAHVGVMDMLRFHKFTIGHAWTSDFGNAEENEDEYDAILKYSPLHNVGTETIPHPPVLLCTADHDDRVVPLHSFKLAAELQHTVGGRSNQLAPLLIRIDRKAGHGAGKPLSKTIEEHADVFGFIASSIGAEFKD